MKSVDCVILRDGAIRPWNIKLMQMGWGNGEGRWKAEYLEGITDIIGDRIAAIAQRIAVKANIEEVQLKPRQRALDLDADIAAVFEPNPSVIRSLATEMRLHPTMRTILFYTGKYPVEEICVDIQKMSDAKKYILADYKPPRTLYFTDIEDEVATNKTVGNALTI